MLVLIKGAGDLATGVAVRLRKANIDVIMTEIALPSAIRRTVAFSDAVYHGVAKVEEFTGRLVKTTDEAKAVIAKGEVPVMVDEECTIREILKPDVVVDAIIAKRNLGTAITDAKLVLALGPGFTVGVDCHAAIETKRGHDLGRVYYNHGESPIPNTGIPGLIAGYGAERVMHSPAAGIFHCIKDIGDTVEAGDIVAEVGGEYVRAAIPGILRGLLPEGFDTTKGLKCADVDPRCKKEHCFTVTDKSRALGGGVLEAMLHFGVI